MASGTLHLHTLGEIEAARALGFVIDAEHPRILHCADGFITYAHNDPEDHWEGVLLCTPVLCVGLEGVNRTPRFLVRLNSFNAGQLSAFVPRGAWTLTLTKGE